ncbi:MAG: prepilin-type N-terminal cleavage/methylation domain-containing protein [Pseudomonadales bacterium]
MSSPMREHGFTLIELTVIVIVLAVVVGVVARGLSDTPARTRQIALVGTLASLRKAIDVYGHEHGVFPGLISAVPPKGTCRVGLEGTGIGWPDGKGVTEAFNQQLTSYTTSGGGACSVGGDPFLYGPYFRNVDLPENPITGSNAITIVGDGDLYMKSDARPAGGWKYDVLTGKLIADDPKYDHL